MRYGIFSDIHSNLEALRNVIKAYKKERIDTYLCIGDVVGYASNPQECLASVKSICSVIVAGNHDWAVSGLFPIGYFNSEAKDAILWTKKHMDSDQLQALRALPLVYENKDLVLVHGTLVNPAAFDYMTDSSTAIQSFTALEKTVCFVGHTHQPVIFSQNKAGVVSRSLDKILKLKEGYTYIVNVGSVGQPRDGDPKASYCIYDTEKKELLIKRVAYTIAAAREKIYAAGLPRFLGDRLLAGH